ncbi:uncharacterized protein [Diadema setosum]|uniref:uncharacterized protein n=1 Tax=Diadema setosum TaxID=31175 RepID=UPI003B3ACFEE
MTTDYGSQGKQRYTTVQRSRRGQDGGRGVRGVVAGICRLHRGTTHQLQSVGPMHSVSEARVGRVERLGIKNVDKTADPTYVIWQSVPGKCMRFSYTYGIYIYPVKFEMRVKCYEGTPPVKLVDGPSPFEGLVVIEPDSYVCYDGFPEKAAEVICGELGFPAAEEYSAQALPSTVQRNNYQRLSCPGNSYQRVMDCSPATTRCPLQQIVRLKCRDSLGSCDDPGHVYHGYWNSSITNFGSRLTLTCVEGYVINDNATLQCVVLPGWSNYFPVWKASVPSCLRVGNNGLKTGVAYTLGALLCVISTLSLVSIAFCKQLQKRRQRPLAASDRSNGHTNDAHLQHLRETDRGVSLNPARADSGTVSDPFPDPPDNRHGTLSTHQENPYHISQNLAEVDMTSCHRAEVEKTSFPPRQEYHSLQETSKAQDECYQDRDYHDNDRTTDRMTSGAAKPCGRAHLFDERCYNSLNFGVRSDGVCTRTQDGNISNAHPQRGRHADKSDLNRTPLKVGSSKVMSSEEVFYYQVEADNDTDTCKAPLYAKVDKARGKNNVVSTSYD